MPLIEFAFQWINYFKDTWYGRGNWCGKYGDHIGGIEKWSRTMNFFFVPYEFIFLIFKTLIQELNEIWSAIYVTTRVIKVKETTYFSLHDFIGVYNKIQITNKNRMKEFIWWPLSPSLTGKMFRENTSFPNFFLEGWSNKQWLETDF